MAARGKRVAAIAALVGALTLGLSACEPPGRSLAVVGTSTTQNAMAELTDQFNASPSASTAVNVPSVLAPNQSVTVPADAQCGAVTYNAANPPPPDSDQAFAAILADNSGCVDIARSGRGAGAAGVDVYAFAREAVTWTRFTGTPCPGSDVGPPGCAPANLTVAQLRGIYLCTEPGGVPAITNWNQVGGDNGAIVRFLPALGSPTLTWFEIQLLGIPADQTLGLDSASCATPPKLVTADDGTKVTADERAIFAYSVSAWAAQQGGAVTDRRGGAERGSVNGIAPTPTTIANNTFPAVRYVSNAVKTTGKSTPSALRFIGVDVDNGNGFLCTDDATKNATVTKYGFVLLPLAPAGPGLPASRCRKNP
jgi:ABC-type phosphate transport system substrate-binding protein